MREKRKLDHLKLALQSNTQSNSSSFDELHFVHRSLPEKNVQESTLSTKIGGQQLNSPLIINAMTGGAFSTEKVNHDLAVIASETGIALAVGSQKAALRNKELIRTYQIVREVNSKGPIFANLSADSHVEDAMNAIDMIQADMLQLHLNIPQELVMPEGDRNFNGIIDKIHRIKEAVSVPVIVKEVGFGMCQETYKVLNDIGIEIIDVGGKGGTNFVWIENERREAKDFDFIKNWGQSAALSLIESSAYQDKIDFISSGGIRNPLDMVKSFALGAKGVGLASPILALLKEHGIEKTIDQIHNWHDQLKSILTMLGISCIEDVIGTPLIIGGTTKEWCECRDIDYKVYAKRGLSE
ncbi:type 2 isopentenyl-diphosphate Delta-isomerase [Chengkuizengella axinellae]|uniref:Isopentenyl-diphosphate delta-isomerase n=1 Tax=Chengkuizengella axinellae TaxID=3064388 RepID=A0ABT9J4T1_9BACL|nr:type 2 isopentenyl-diphosphate Delta-isomerase [Chengkuizengella sp. 2205SS18-9]MDP5276627.1 type 2 isopentenyl-diphosphate Delta-isomerase [Chengkuizengella sp. 2205SS18-9]